MAFQILRIVVASGCIALLLIAVIVTAVLTARRPGRLRILRAVSFILGWPLFLIPSLRQFYYGPLGANPQSAGNAYAPFDLSLLVGFLLIYAYLLPEVFRLIFRQGKQDRAEIATVPQDRFYRFGILVVIVSMSATSHGYTDPIVGMRFATDMQGNLLWWNGLVGMLTGMLLVAIAEIKQARSTMEPPPLLDQRIEQSAAAEEGE